MMGQPGAHATSIAGRSDRVVGSLKRRGRAGRHSLARPPLLFLDIQMDPLNGIEHGACSGAGALAVRPFVTAYDLRARSL